MNLPIVDIKIHLQSKKFAMTAKNKAAGDLRPLMIAQQTTNYELEPISRKSPQFFSPEHQLFLFAVFTFKIYILLFLN